jgi:hypothetical protein
MRYPPNLTVLFLFITSLAHPEIVGDTLFVGTTWWEQQQIGSVGRMLAVDDEDAVHLVWTRGFGHERYDSHVFYNKIDDAGQILGTHPVITFDLFPRGWNRVQAATVVMQQSGPVITQPVYLADLETIWPKLQIDLDGRVHIFATDPGSNGNPMTHLFACGEYQSSSGGIGYPLPAETWTELSATLTPGRAVATSDVSDRVAFGWTRCKNWQNPWMNEPDRTMDNDLYLLIDDDGQNIDPEEYFNLTQFRNRDPAWLPDTLMANMDTLRVCNDLDLLFDQDDWLHCAFTTRLYYWFPDTSRVNGSIVWHWSEQFPGEYQIIHNATDDINWNRVNCGYLNLMAQQPSLGQDPETGYLYCTYQVYDCDTTHLSRRGYPSGDIYVSVSTDGGQNWSVGTNITGTTTPGGALPGDCFSEIHPSLAKLVNGACNITYVLDRDAGYGLHGEGEWTENEFVYHKVPVDLIPHTPLVPQNIPFHVQHGWPCSVNLPEIPTNHAVMKTSVNPNPFNPSTTISFNLSVASLVSLDIFDINGRRVGARLVTPYPPGTHHIAFDGSNFPSGIYIYRLNAANYSATGKMVLMK